MRCGVSLRLLKPPTHTLNPRPFDPEHFNPQAEGKCAGACAFRTCNGSRLEGFKQSLSLLLGQDPSQSAVESEWLEVWGA